MPSPKQEEAALYRSCSGQGRLSQGRRRGSRPQPCPSEGNHPGGTEITDSNQPPQKQHPVLLLTGLCYTEFRQITLWCKFMLLKRDQPPEVVPSSLFKQIYEFLEAVKSCFLREDGLSLLPLRVFLQPTRSSVSVPTVFPRAPSLSG